MLPPKNIRKDLHNIKEDFAQAQKAKQAGDTAKAQKIVAQAKRKAASRRNDWPDFAWKLLIIYLSIVFTIFLAYINIKGIYKDVYIWPFWLLMFCGLFLTPLFIKMAIEQYKVLRKKWYGLQYTTPSNWGILDDSAHWPYARIVVEF